MNMRSYFGDTTLATAATFRQRKDGFAVIVWSYFRFKFFN
jgi:hypothetical protein